MSQQPLNLSPDLKRLEDDGYEVEVRAGHLLVASVPYVNSKKEVKFGVLVSELTLAGEITTTPGTHVVMFSGEHPCNRDGAEIAQIKHTNEQKTIVEGLVVHHSFSNKPPDGYKDYYDKMTTYATIISGPAEAINPDVTARTRRVIPSENEESVFHYTETASSRAGINEITKKLEIGKVAILGLGGTGSYVLDLVAKTPVKEIHLFDGDIFLQHNAFRSPGAPSIEELKGHPKKVYFFRDRYSAMRKNIVAHDILIDSSNVSELEGMDFVFLCIDGSASKRVIIETLESSGVPFVDVGMGVQISEDNKLFGILRTTTSTESKRDHVRNKSRIAFVDANVNNDYSQNIQIADLNALNAALAVIKWKKLFGFYLDLDQEHHATYTIDGNIITNDDKL